jgi:LmbE family N-acetylglucosaminyl deacetylase
VIGKDTRLLVLAPHVDDELNCGGTIARVTDAGGRALIVAGSPCHLSVRAEDARLNIVEEFEKSCALFRADHLLLDYPLRRFGDSRQEILDDFIERKKAFDPTLVLCPSSTDVHQDHGVVYAEALRSCRFVPMLLGWESPNNQIESRIDEFVQLWPEHLEAKVAAWRLYQTQHHRDWFNEDMIRELAGVRGKQCRCDTRLAEAFQHLRAIH